jgi:hypothetical protein
MNTFSRMEHSGNIRYDMYYKPRIKKGDRVRFVCCQCSGGEACTFEKPNHRKPRPMICGPDNFGRVTVPHWQEIPKKDDRSDPIGEPYTGLPEHVCKCKA